MAEPTPRTVTALAPDGTPIEVPVSEAGALNRGQEGRVLSPEEAARVQREVELQNKLDGVEGYVMPGLVGAARGLTFGLSDHALASSPLLQSRLKDYEEYGGAAMKAGELAGMFGGALTGIGAPALAERAGLAAERAGLGMIGRGAVEGALFGEGDAISQAALSDHDLTAEALIGGGAHGALGGAVAMGALGQVGKAFGKVRGSAAEGYEALLAKRFGEAAPGAGRELAAAAEAEAGTASKLGGPYRAPEGMADTVASKYIDSIPGASSVERAQYAEAWAARERILSKHADTIETATRETSNALDDALKAGRKTDMASFGDSKINQMSRLVDASNAEAQAARSVGWLEQADPLVRELAADVNSKMTRGELKQWDGWVSKLRSAAETRDSMSMHTTLDNLKRWVGKQAEFGRGPFGLDRAAKEFDALYQGENGLKGLLEDNVWGTRAAQAQRDINQATASMLSEGKLFKQKYTTEFGSELGRPLYAANTQAVSGFMGKLTSAANDLDAKAFEGWVQTRQRFLDAVGKNYTFDEATQAAIAKERAALAKLDSVYRTTTKDVQLANQVKQALAEERERGIGGAVGAVFDIASKPYTTLQRLAQLETQTRGVVNKIAGGAKDLVGSSTATKAASTAESGGGAKKFFTAMLDSASGAASGAKTATSAAGSAASRSLFTKRVQQLATLQSNPMMVADKVQQSLGPVESAAPRVMQQATTTALRGLDFLSSKLPPSRIDPYSVQPQLQAPTRASDAEISRFMRYTQAVDDPLIVLREAKTGTLTRDHVEAVQAVYPKLYDEIRSSVFRSLVDSKTEIPYQRKIQLGILLDLPTDKTLSPDFIGAVQATFSSADQAGAEPPPTTSAAPDIAASFQTATERATERAQ